MPATTLRTVIVAGLTHLTLDCRHCPRSGRYAVARLVERFGLDETMFEVLRAFSADCPRRVAELMHEVCGARCSDLRRVG